MRHCVSKRILSLFSQLLRGSLPWYCNPPPPQAPPPPSVLLHRQHRFAATSLLHHHQHLDSSGDSVTVGFDLVEDKVQSSKILHYFDVQKIVLLIPNESLLIELWLQVSVPNMSGINLLWTANSHLNLSNETLQRAAFQRQRVTTSASQNVTYFREIVAGHQERKRE